MEGESYDQADQNDLKDLAGNEGSDQGVGNDTEQKACRISMCRLLRIDLN